MTPMQREEKLAGGQSWVQLRPGLHRTRAALSKLLNLLKPQFPFCLLEMIPTLGDYVRKCKSSTRHSLTHSKYAMYKSAINY